MLEVFDSLPTAYLLDFGLFVGLVVAIAIATHAIEKALGKLEKKLDEISALLRPISEEVRERQQER